MDTSLRLPCGSKHYRESYDATYEWNQGAYDRMSMHMGLRRVGCASHRNQPVQSAEAPSSGYDEKHERDRVLRA